MPCCPHPTPCVPTDLVLLREVRFDWHHKSLALLRVRSRPARAAAAIDAFEATLVARVVTSDAASARAAAEWRRRMHHEVCPAIVAQMAEGHAARQQHARAPLPLPVAAELRAPAALPLTGASATGAECPPAYANVLRLLREADASGAWPATSRARARVLSALDATAGGSFSVVSPARADAILEARGARRLPRQLPRGNLACPELAEAVFELERALAPGRPPSTMVAINRRASFRPHTDAGAGLGQTTSLIVGLGDYTGGELAVEGAVVPIRYVPHEFDGWRSRHWTLPFAGERFSLVWFSPADEGDSGGRYRALEAGGDV